MKWLFGLTIGMAFFGAVGCGIDSGDTNTGGGGSGGSGGGSPCDQDPASGPVLEECGVWVSAAKGDDANPGTQAAPVASLVLALELAQKGPRHVYACAETWTEPLVVPGNFGLHGGFDCSGDTWVYAGSEKRSSLTTPPDEIAVIISDDGTGGKATIMDFDITSASAMKPGGSSIAVFVRDTVPLWLYRCDVVAGDGADGLDGTPADPGEQPAPDGPPGMQGEAACSSVVSKGGASPEAECNAGAVSKGGAGGDGALTTAGDGAPGEPASDNPEDGAGGIGEKNAVPCTDGRPGGIGADGAYGLGGRGFDSFKSGKGRLTEDGYLGTDGEPGKHGKPGQGGGGGGARLGSTVVCSAGSPCGAAGGSGGAGGCGGKPGGGGQAGGASIAVALRNGLAFFGTSLYSGKGGKGGNGAPGQAGGSGGAGGPGGAGAGALKPGCSGGVGGAGGKGGWGGGGLGGSSLVVVVLITLQGPDNWALGSDDMSGGYPGEGGIGGEGDPAHDDADGASGIAAPADFLEP